MTREVTEARTAGPRAGGGKVVVTGRARSLSGLLGLLALAELAGLAGCVAASREEMSTHELLASVRARAADLRTRIFYAERRADALKTRARASRRLADEVREDLRTAGVRVGRRGAAVIVGVAAKIAFGPGEVDLGRDARKELDGLAVLLKTRLANRLVSVAGHSDASTPRGAADGWRSNWELSTARAVVVARYLIEACGLSPERISVVAHGETQPVASNDTKEGRAQNRRVEIVLLPPIETTRVSARIE